ncbi:YcaO-like family protein [Thiotrichales bacterium 19S9-12]|nr:YcaO-like family protein [Thiotrichales bacterium 19S9-11]MCF6810869.1 YcaO-like family protein [Thiotrichales bacterium 19S9-12]
MNLALRQEENKSNLDLANSLREMPLQDTLNNILPYLEKVKISRLADITHLDEIGVPVYLAIRPLAKSLSVSQGKGLSKLEAQISAYMESIEVYFSEEVLADIKNKSATENQLFIDPNQLTNEIIFHKNHLFNWCKVRSFISQKSYYVPLEFLSIDTTNPHVTLLGSNTTGLASGNTKKEALVHSLLETIERKYIQHTFSEVRLDAKNKLYDILSYQHIVKIVYYNNPLNIPIFGCFLKNKNSLESQAMFCGYGCHLNKSVALNRAITEAIQAKLTLIAGSRDDIIHHQYNEHLETKLPTSDTSIQLSQVEQLQAHTVSDALLCIKNILKKHNLDSLLYVYHQENLCFLKTILIDQKVIP